ncbi:hypothetical protein EMPS_09465 [Entomortierella parvispora]|uniref:Arm-like repeat domain-containing protein n=1 Tax=Entomortierella parvispora TaxID=205924 RepID=A0A9P3HI83_9FUNG|nr:hypothetical protein EMPS_09465 [Entomortierella parvispora]
MTVGTPPLATETPHSSVGKKKSIFSLFSKKRATPPVATHGQQSNPSSDSTVVAAASSSLASPAGKSKAQSPSLNNPSQPKPSTPHRKAKVHDIALGIFPNNVPLNDTEIEPPEMVGYIRDTSQLVSYHHLLVQAKEVAAASATPSSSSISRPPTPTPSTPPAPSPALLPTLTPAQLEWTQEMDRNPLEKEHLQKLLTEVINQFILHPSKSDEALREIVLVGPVLDKDQYRTLLNRLLEEFKQDTILNVELLRGLTQLIQDAKPGYLRSDDFTLILRVIRSRDQKLDEYLFYLTVTVATILNSIVDEKVVGGLEIEGLDRVSDHDPVLELLSDLRNKEDPFLKFQALYAYQALQWVPNGETTLQCGLRHLEGVVGGVVKLSAVVQLDFQGFMEGLQAIQKDVGEFYDFVSSGWEDAKTLIEDGKGLFSLGAKRRHPWYVGLRGAERLVAKGRLADFNELVSTAPCRDDPLFLWGIAQLLGDIAVDSAWKRDNREQALKFLGVLYRAMASSETYRSVQSWILTILATISSLSASSYAPSYSSSNEQEDAEIKKQAGDLAQDLKSDGNTALSFPYPLRRHLELPKSSILLKKVDDKLDLELVIDRLRRIRIRDYEQPSDSIELICKRSLRLPDDKDSPVPLHQRVKDFLQSKAAVMLIHGEAESGKSAFALALEHELWLGYQAGDPIPLFIDLTTLETLGDKLIQQHLGGLGEVSFSESHLSELRRSRRPIILICDRYEECQKWCNLYSENKMSEEIKIIVTCQSQYLISTYRVYFEPRSKDIYSKKKPQGLYEEAVIVSPKTEQIEE